MTDQLAPLAGALRNDVAVAPMPAVGLGVETIEGPLFREVSGTANTFTGEPAGPGHLWDLASLTKPLLTATSVLALVDEGMFGLDTPLDELLPASAGRPIGRLPISTVLSHGTRLPPDRPLYREHHPDRASMVTAVLDTNPVSASAIYSDLNYMLLGEALESASGRPLRDFAAERGLTTTSPSRPGPSVGFVATEMCGWRGRLIQGEVHDENAAAWGGVAGHAAGFATLATVAEMTREWLGGDEASTSTRDAATRVWSSNSTERFGLGFLLGSTRGLGGRTPGQDAFGASGFVGNRNWVEPRRGYAVVILGNRIHPTRGDRGPFDQWCGDVVELVGRLLHR